MDMTLPRKLVIFQVKLLAWYNKRYATGEISAADWKQVGIRKIPSWEFNEFQWSVVV